MSHADTSQAELAQCRGVRRMHLNSNMSVCEQAPVSQFSSSAHGSLLRANFQAYGNLEDIFNMIVNEGLTIKPFIYYTAV